MKLDRARALELVSNKLGSHPLISVGWHGTDAGALVGLPQFSYCISHGVALGAPQVQDFSVEEQSGLRHDQVNPTPVGSFLALKAMSEALMKASQDPCTVLAFAPLPFLERLGWERPLARYLGMPWSSFQFFNSKSGVEKELASTSGDLVFVPWRTLPADPSRMQILRDELRRHPVVLRLSSSQAGMGHELIRDESELAGSRFVKEETVSIGPYLEAHIPLSVGACVFPDGEVTLHSPSLQLVGVPVCTNLQFGYCGNDFVTIKNLDRRLLARLEVSARAVGRWLHSRGYVGVFGIDAMVYEGEVLFSEVNPRFQGSTWLTAQMDSELGIPDMVLDHLMAWLGIESYKTPPLSEIVEAQPRRSQVLLFNKRDKRVEVSKDGLSASDDIYAVKVPANNVMVDPGELMFALVLHSAVTPDGRSLEPEEAGLVDSSLRCVHPRDRMSRRRVSGLRGERPIA